MRYGRVSILAVAAAGLLAISMLAAAGVDAQTPSGPPPAGGYGHRFFGRALLGTVASVSSDSLVLTTWTGQTVTLRTTPETRAISRQQAGPADLAAGDFVRVGATKTQDGALSARSINAVPASFAMAPAPAPGSATPPPYGPRGAGRGRMRGGLTSGPDGSVMIAGPLARVSNGTIWVSMPAGSPIAVAVPGTARITRLVSPAVASLAPGTHVIVRTVRPRGPQQPANATGAQPPLTAAVIFVVPAGTR